MNHFTNTNGYNGIRAFPVWHFWASKPPGDHPLGAYFTTLSAKTPSLAKRLGIPKSKLKYVFSFTNLGDLTPLPGARGRFIFYSGIEYKVAPERQTYCGKAADS
jgi:hypothetical protein